VNLTTIINEKDDGSCSVTTVLRDDTGHVLARKTEGFSCRQAAVVVVAGLRAWATERGIKVGVADN